MKKYSINLVLSVLILFSLTSCKDTRPDMAMATIRDRISTESQGALYMLSFLKTNGVELSTGGTPTYEVEFNLVVIPKTKCWKNDNAFQGYWDDFTVATKLPEDGWERRRWDNARKFVVGYIIELKGKAKMVKKDNGWVVEKITIL
jgi:hypothetical protein